MEVKDLNGSFLGEKMFWDMSMVALLVLQQFQGILGQGKLFDLRILNGTWAEIDLRKYGNINNFVGLKIKFSKSGNNFIGFKT